MREEEEEEGEEVAVVKALITPGRVVRSWRNVDKSRG
jgi:hypothetical protein